jgi:hypothetical protein
MQYFESRPHLFQQQSNAKPSDNFSALSSLAGSNPKMTATALKSAGVPPSLAKPSNVSAASSASKHLNGIGSKVGQLSGKFGNHFANSEQDQQQPPPPSSSSKPNSFMNMNKLGGQCCDVSTFHQQFPLSAKNWIVSFFFSSFFFRKFDSLPLGDEPNGFISHPADQQPKLFRPASYPSCRAFLGGPVVCTTPARSSYTLEAKTRRGIGGSLVRLRGHKP